MKSIKKVIFNDPIYGFITIPYHIVQLLLEHPYIQRMRRIRQLGMTHLVYPGAYNTRFHHAMGSMHLMGEAIKIIRSKGHTITDKEAEAATIAILLHDIGHGPFSHALEKNIVQGVTHEDLTNMFMERLNEEMKGRLSLAIEIFRNTYQKKFLHQLISSQLDMDRLDYLRRDSYYTGVAEGIISTDRIIEMLNVADDRLVVDVKGIYSIEQFLMARRFMYWQVYLHKTVISAEFLLIKILERARQLAERGKILFATPALEGFLYNKIDKSAFKRDKSFLDNFSKLDDYDIFTSVKVWADHEDKVLSRLCNNIVNRNLFRIRMQNNQITKDFFNDIHRKVMQKYHLSETDAGYFVFTDTIVNKAYETSKGKINILYKNGKLNDIGKASDQLNLSVLSKKVRKYFICFPKDIIY